MFTVSIAHNSQDFTKNKINETEIKWKYTKLMILGYLITT